MSVRIEQILPLTVKQTGGNDLISDLLDEIMVLEAKISSAERESFYFQMALPAHRQRLNRLKADYERYRILFSTSNRNFLLSQLARAKEDTKKWEKKCIERPNAVNLIALSACRHNQSVLQNLLEAKTKYGYLPAITGSIFTNSAHNIN